MSTESILIFTIVASGFIGLPLFCFIFYIWYEYKEDYIARACRRADKRYYKWEQGKKKKTDKS